MLDFTGMEGVGVRMKNRGVMVMVMVSELLMLTTMRQFDSPMGCRKVLSLNFKSSQVTKTDYFPGSI